MISSSMLRRKLLQGIGLRASHYSTSAPYFMQSHSDALAKKPKVVLLENIHPKGVEILEGANFDVHCYSRALEGDELLEVAADCHILGIRSKTTLDRAFFETVGHKKHRLWTVGAFCIGTNQIDLAAASDTGVSVFNAPFSNTRSVAEKTVCEIIALERRLFERSLAMHRGYWEKTAKRSHEIRGTTVGIIGYGHIGAQVSVLCELMGMKVIYYDTMSKLCLGNARRCESIEELYREADVITCHVPDNPHTRNMIGDKQIQLMKPGTKIINNARGQVINLEDLAQAIKSEHIGGAAVDVFPVEPAKNEGGFVTPLTNLPNVILTPHIGGSTEEAQEKIAEEVAHKLIRIMQNGSTTSCKNMPEVECPPPTADVHRLIHFHQNVPGVLAHVNNIISDTGANITSQSLKTDETHGYLILDVERKHAQDLKAKLSTVPNTVFVRSLLRSTGEFGQLSL